MTTMEVTTQEELDRALANPECHRVVIRGEGAFRVKSSVGNVAKLVRI